MYRGFALTLLVFVVNSRAARGELLWDGDPAKGTGVLGDFGGGECAAPGSVTVVTDPMFGSVFRYDKPTGLNRCESKGIRVGGVMYTFKNNDTFYFGWWTKLTSTANNNANFQWKSYNNHTQNFPVFIKMIGGRINLMQHQPNASCCDNLWSAPIATNSWNHIVLGLHLSDQLTGGWIEFWFNGVQQKFRDGSMRFTCRTLDDTNHPKWGVYGAAGEAFTNFIRGQKVGTTYADVAMNGSTAPAPTDAGSDPVVRDAGPDSSADDAAPRDSRPADPGTGSGRGSGGGGGSDGGRRTAGASGASGGGGSGWGGTGGAGDDPVNPPARRSAGASGCHVGGPSAHESALFVAVAIGLVLARRRQRA